MLCKAPWNHIQINAEGVINPCCMFAPTMYKKEYNSLQEAFDGPENEDLRTKMLSGEKVKGCEKCDLYTEIGIEPFRSSFEKYDINNPKIRELEFSLDNHCNFKCVTCNSQFADGWYKEDIELIDMGLDREKSKAIKQGYGLIKYSGSIKDLDLSELRYLKMLGGEPFINSGYLEVLQSIDLTNVTVLLTTNNSVFPKDWIDTILKCDQVRIVMSLDGVDDVGEFVRYGMKQSRFTKNLMKWKEISDDYEHVVGSFNYVFHILNSFNLNKTIEYTDRTGWRFYVDFLTTPEYLNVQYLPSNLKQEIKQNITKCADADAIENYLDDGMYNENHMKDFIKYINFLEQRSILPAECEYIYEKILYYN